MYSAFTGTKDEENEQLYITHSMPAPILIT